MALVDAHNRCIEERRRAAELLQLRKVWESRGIGGVENNLRAAQQAKEMLVPRIQG